MGTVAVSLEARPQLLSAHVHRNGTIQMKVALSLRMTPSSHSKTHGKPGGQAAEERQRPCILVLYLKAFPLLLE